MGLSIVILAAGKGKRMRSGLPKVLHQLAAKPLLSHVIDTASRLLYSEIYVVYGHAGEQLKSAFAEAEVTWVEQAEQLGSGHAVSQAIDHIPSSDNVLILYGDVPLISYKTLKRLVIAVEETGIALLTTHLEDSTGYGRIVRDEAGEVSKIVEDKDASTEQHAIKEINTGMLVVKSIWLRRWLQALSNENAQKEYYLTDIVAAAVAEKIIVTTVNPGSAAEIQGVNDKIQLAELERHYQLQQAQKLMRKGVTLLDPQRFDCRGTLKTGKDVVIDVNALFEGDVTLGNNVVIGPNCQINNASLSDNVTVKANTVIENAVIGAHCELGPFARIRPETELAEKVTIGNFVEIKKSRVAQDTKISHLSYIGDSDIGAGVNVGAGTITCNYDGVNKHQTIIGDNVFVGSNTEIVAPVKIEEGAYIGSGSTITKHVDADNLVISRVAQKVVKGWQRPKKK